MTLLRRNVSSIKLLSTFESAARLGSFTTAASELGVTQAAVSQQIKALERELNTPLFFRAHRRVVLTPEGRALAASVSTAFTTISDVIDTIRRPEVPDTVSIGVTLATNQFWLMPRLPDFRARHPNIKLRILADDGPMDVRQARLDLAIRYGKPPFDDAVSLANRQEDAFPVCSPSLLLRLGVDPETADIMDLPLIGSDLVNPSLMPWRAWGRILRLGPAFDRAAAQTRLRFNHYSDTVQAALNGEGVTMGWSVLLSDFLADSRLVRIGRVSLTPDERYHVVIPKGRAPLPVAQQFLDWLTEQISQDSTKP